MEHYDAALRNHGIIEPTAEYYYDQEPDHG
jgi:hypothetical protein